MPNELSSRSSQLAGGIRAEMARKEITVNQVADAIGMPISTLRRSVKGQRPFTIDELDSIAGYLGFTLSELLGMSENAA